MAVQLTHSGQELDNAIGKVLGDYADVSGVTATASDVAAGKYFVDANKTLVEGTASGGGSMYSLEVSRRGYTIEQTSLYSVEKVEV